jgi:hypothetical protein
MTKISGLTTFHSETGTEGGHWAFQDSSWIHRIREERPNWCKGGLYCPITSGLSDSHWSYDGLHILNDGDHLKILTLDSTLTKWEGVIQLKRFRLFTETTREGFWIHSEQSGIDREEWELMFLIEHQAILIPASKPETTFS